MAEIGAFGKSPASSSTVAAGSVGGGGNGGASAPLAKQGSVLKNLANWLGNLRKKKDPRADTKQQKKNMEDYDIDSQIKVFYKLVGFAVRHFFN